MNFLRYLSYLYFRTKSNASWKKLVNFILRQIDCWQSTKRHRYRPYSKTNAKNGLVSEWVTKRSRVSWVSEWVSWVSKCDSMRWRTCTLTWYHRSLAELGSTTTTSSSTHRTIHRSVNQWFTQWIFTRSLTHSDTRTHSYIHSLMHSFTHALID
jgi:hypothetical protein